MKSKEFRPRRNFRAHLGTAPRRTANRPGSQRMARYKITDFLQSATAGRHAADGDRPRSGGSFEMRPQFPAVALYKKWWRALSFSSESNPSSGCVILGIVELDQVMKKFILRSAVILLVCIVLLVAASIYFLGSIIKKGFETVGPQITKTEMKMDGATLSLLSGSGKLKGLFVGNPEGFRA